MVENQANHPHPGLIQTVPAARPLPPRAWPAQKTILATPSEMSIERKECGRLTNARQMVPSGRESGVS